MILQALVEYYEALERKGKITSPGWCRAKVAYGLDISEQGELKSVIPLKQERQKGKKTVTVPQNLTVPQMVSRSSGVSSHMAMFSMVLSSRLQIWLCFFIFGSFAHTKPVLNLKHKQFIQLFREVVKHDRRVCVWVQTL